MNDNPQGNTAPETHNAPEANETATTPESTAPEGEMTDTPLAGEVHHSHLGPILGVLIVVLVVVLGGLYLWGSALVQQAEAPTIAPRSIPNNEPETPRATTDADILNTVSSSNELEAIEADLESTQIDNLDTELDEIDRELNSAL